jgi:hypothetical protein
MKIKKAILLVKNNKTANSTAQRRKTGLLQWQVHRMTPKDITLPGNGASRTAVEAAAPDGKDGLDLPPKNQVE